MRSAGIASIKCSFVITKIELLTLIHAVSKNLFSLAWSAVDVAPGLVKRSGRPFRLGHQRAAVFHHLAHQLEVGSNCQLEGEISFKFDGFLWGGLRVQHHQGNSRWG